MFARHRSFLRRLECTVVDEQRPPLKQASCCSHVVGVDGWSLISTGCGVTCTTDAPVDTTSSTGRQLYRLPLLITSANNTIMCAVRRTTHRMPLPHQTPLHGSRTSTGRMVDVSTSLTLAQRSPQNVARHRHNRRAIFDPAGTAVQTVDR